MPSNLLQNAIRLQAMRAAAASQLQTRVGTVTNYNEPYMVRLMLLPENLHTGWVPIATPWAGNGWGFYSPPAIGTSMMIEYIDGDVNGGIAVAQLFNDGTYPLNVPSGELWIVHAKGGYFKLTNDGKVSFSDGQGATLTFNGDGTIDSAASTWSHTGKLSVSGDITSSGGDVSDQKGTMQSMRSTYNSHTQPVSGSTAEAPAQQM